MIPSELSSEDIIQTPSDPVEPASNESWSFDDSAIWPYCAHSATASVFINSHCVVIAIVITPLATQVIREYISDCKVPRHGGRYEGFWTSSIMAHNSNTHKGKSTQKIRLIRNLHHKHKTHTCWAGLGWGGDCGLGWAELGSAALGLAVLGWAELGRAELG